jgi:hypothetical protein
VGEMAIMNYFCEEKKYYDKRREEIKTYKNANGWDLQIDTYGGKPYISPQKCSEKLVDIIKEKNPFSIGRFGETELKTLFTYEYLYSNLKKRREVNRCICNNAGFFPLKTKAIKKFCDIEKEALMNVDIMCIFLWENEEFMINKFSKPKMCMYNGILDPLYCNGEWLGILKGKKVLVVHPFTDSIIAQYARKDKLFENPNFIPEFDLKTVRAVQSVGGKGAFGYKSWFEALDDMKEQIAKCDFDIALLGCGAYGLPLASVIKNMGKQAIYMGGSLQLMFGIVGKRWENFDYVKKHINEYWVRPSENERPKQSSKVEGGCYW